MKPAAGPIEGLPVIAIVGRPNVGKSTLFNRLVGRREALVLDVPGVTRDRKEAAGRLFDLNFTVVDTAGLEEADVDAIESRMVKQTMRAIEGADAALFMIDGRAGVTPLDEHFAGELRRSSTPVILIANKCEGSVGKQGALEAYSLGFGEPVLVSSEHGVGMDDLHQAMVASLPGSFPKEPVWDTEEADGDEDQDEVLRPLSLAIVGRPNAGKSTLFNQLLDEDRVITGPEPGLTRDSISIDWSWQDRKIKLIDTAGVRRRARVDQGVEQLSVMDSFRAIQYADTVILMIDAQTIQDFGQGIEKQDLTIARHVEEEGRGLVIAANKWDLVTDPGKLHRQIMDSLEDSLGQLRGVSLVGISALEGSKLDVLMGAVLKTDAAWNSRVTTGKLNQWLAVMQEEHQPPLSAGRRVKIRFMTQVKARPPSFALFVNKPEALPDSYVRYLSNGLRRDFDLQGVPLRLMLRRGRNPYARK